MFSRSILRMFLYDESTKTSIYLIINVDIFVWENEWRLSNCEKLRTENFRSSEAHSSEYILFGNHLTIYLSLLGDTASNLGNAMDELMRHQPSLRTDATRAIIKLLEEVAAMGENPNFVCQVRTDRRK